MNTPDQTSSSRTMPLLTVGLVVLALYFARDFLIPLALAVLIGFLLAPLIRRLERWRLGRIPSVLVATMLAFGAIGLVGYVVTGQMIDLANQLPGYQTNLQAKVASLKSAPNGTISKATKTLRDLTEQITNVEPDAAAPTANAEPSNAARKKANTPQQVEVVYSTGSALEVLRNVVAPVLGPLGTAAIVVILVIFMLLEREDLRDRMIHLVGRRQLRLTTQALDEAGQRVSRYLLAQLIVNVTYGIPIGIGLYFIGIPNAILWGVLATVLRFVPYIGAWISAAFPLALSLAVSPSWTAPLCTIGLFVVVELISNNVVEPWLYGASTGLSPMAVIVSAIFWAWLWGTVGLLLATPLTVCIAVMGKYIPSLAFLDVLLGDKPPIAAEDRFYQRLLAMDAEETLELVEEHAAAHGLGAAFGQLIVPVLRLAESDYRQGALQEGPRREMYRALRDLIGEFGKPPEAADARVLCVPASNEADELAAVMLARLCGESGVAARVLSAKLMTSELVEQAAELLPSFICISAVPPGSAISAANLCKRLRERCPGVVLAIGLWGEDATEGARRLQRLKRAQADHVFTGIEAAAAEILRQPLLLRPEQKVA